MNDITIKKLNKFNKNVKKLILVSDGIEGLVDFEQFNELVELFLTNNKITGLTGCSDTVKKIYCQNNKIKELNNLPPELQELYCPYNLLSKLPNLPTTLIKLDCSYNFINRLDELPCSITLLNCSYNLLTSLDNLPCLLEYLNCSNNFISSLDNLPSSVVGLVVKPSKSVKLKLKTDEQITTHIENLITNDIPKPNLHIHRNIHRNFPRW